MLDVAQYRTVTPRPATFRRNLRLLAALAIAVRIGIAFSSWRATTRLAEAGAQISRSQEALAALESVRASLDKARSAELTFMLTGSGEDLADYDEAERSTRRQLAHAWTL